MSLKSRRGAPGAKELEGLPTPDALSQDDELLVLLVRDGRSEALHRSRARSSILLRFQERVMRPHRAPLAEPHLVMQLVTFVSVIQSKVVSQPEPHHLRGGVQPIGGTFALPEALALRRPRRDDMPEDQRTTWRKEAPETRVRGPWKSRLCSATEASCGPTSLGMGVLAS